MESRLGSVQSRTLSGMPPARKTLVQSRPLRQLSVTRLKVSMKRSVDGRMEMLEGRFWSRKQKEVDGAWRRGILISVGV